MFFLTFFHSFFRVVSGRFVKRFGGHFGSLLASIFHYFFTLKINRFFDAFWGAFWMDFGGPDPRKWSSRVSETLILIKSPFSSQGRFLMQTGAQKASKMEPKGHSKSMKKVMHFLIEQNDRLLVKNGAQRKPEGIPKSRRLGVFSRLLARTLPKAQN